MSRITKASLLEENQTLKERLNAAEHDVVVVRRARKAAEADANIAHGDLVRLTNACDVSAEQLGGAITQIRAGQKRENDLISQLQLAKSDIKKAQQERDAEYARAETARDLAARWAADAEQHKRSLDYEISAGQNLIAANGVLIRQRDQLRSKLVEVQDAISGD